MDIEEFRKQFIDEIRFEAAHDGTDPESLFIEKTLSELEDIGELNDPIPFSVEMRGSRNRLLAFDAYAYDETDGALVLIASDFTNQRDVAPALTNTKIEDLFSHMLNFIDDAVNGSLPKFCEDSDPALLMGEEFKRKIGSDMVSTEIMRFKFIIISNAPLGKQVKNLSQPDFLGRPVELRVWSLDRLYQYYLLTSNEMLEITTKDFECDGIQSMKANTSAKNESYLCVVPGKFLADIYLNYGTKIMQNNIRSFQRFAGKTNKGIRQSVIHQSKQFFELNNGIVASAQEIKLDKDNKIISFKNLQIINGCQTIVVLASSLIRHETNNDLADLFVPMKLIVVDVSDYKNEYQNERYNEIATVLSETSQSQLPVRRTDFFSNHPFHILMEKLSRKVLAPPVKGNPYETMWFYERSRGKWDQELYLMPMSQIRRFREVNPRGQVIKKEKLAKCYNAILMNPHQVCMGSEDNFIRFTLFIENLYANHKDDINEEFFKKCVCSVILYDTLDILVSNSDWNPKIGDKAQIVPYTISKLMYSLPVGKDIDWMLIWKKQKLYPELEEELKKLALTTNRFLKEKAGRHLVRTISRLHSTWFDFKLVPYELNEEFINTLV